MVALPPPSPANAWPETREPFDARAQRGELYLDALTWFGLLSVTAMLVCYALERRSQGYILGFAIACALGSVY